MGTAKVRNNVAGEVGTPPIWRQRNFLLLWGGQTVGDIGANVTKFVLPFVAIFTLNGSTFEVGLLTAMGTLPFLLVALPAGPLVDRSLKRPMMIACDIGRLVLLLSIPVAAATGSLSMGQLYFVALTVGVLTVFFTVAYQSYVPTLVPATELVEANGKLQTTQSVAELTGPGLSGALVTAMGAALSVLINVGTYAVSALSLLLIRVDEPRSTIGPKRRLRAEIAEGLRFVFGHPVLRRIAATTATGNFFGTIMLALLMLYLARELLLAPWAIGLVTAGGAVGGVIGGLAAGWVGRRIGTARMIWLPALIFNSFGLLIPLARPGWLVVLVPIGFTVLSALGVLYNSGQISYRQSICPPHLLGRMTASIRWVIWGTMPLGALAGGLLGTWLGIRPTLLIAALGDWAGVLFVVFSPLRRLRDIPAE